jgi:biotin-dependent carboxylase-like uncharacterized protein
MADELAVERAGIAAVTDLGRPGLSRAGIPANGAADQHSAGVANLLAGNPEGAPLLEVTATALAFRASRAVVIAVTGAPCTLTVDGRPAPMWRPVRVPAGERVGVTAIREGLRVYVAVHGSLDVPRVLGSCAPDSLLGIGTWLRPGTRLPLASVALAPPDLDARATPPRFGSPWTVDVTDGPEAADFDGSLYDAEYTLSHASNHIGLRLHGPCPVTPRSGELLSRGVPMGAVEVPPAAELLVLMRGRPVTAGYPVVAVATRTARSLLGQVRPGQAIRFRHRTLEQATAAYRAHRQAVRELAPR